MASITVSIKFKNRAFPRRFDVSGEDFNTIKDAIKATGAKFDGLKKVWTLTSKEALDSLKSKLEVSDFNFITNRLPNLSTVWFCETDDPMTGDIHEMREAYNKSDEAFLRYALEHDNINSNPYLKMMKYHQSEPWFSEIVEAYKARQPK